jgi:hypothetical protein
MADARFAIASAMFNITIETVCNSRNYPARVETAPQPLLYGHRKTDYYNELITGGYSDA